MITKPRETLSPPPPEFWGKVKGGIRHIQIMPDGSEATYVIEESPGWREIRYNKRRYRIFFPWVYFFVRVFRTCKTPATGKLYAVVSRQRAKNLDDQCLLYAPFPSVHQNGWVCMPNDECTSEKPIDCALKVIYQFWYANSSELQIYGSDIVPGKLQEKTNSSGKGKVFGNWSKLSPVESLNLDYLNVGSSIKQFCEDVDWNG
jgi:hypothetical protein